MANGWPQLPYVWTLDGVTFGAGDGRFLDAKGWHGAPGRRTNKTARVDADGDYVGSSFRAGRVIEVEGTAVHTSTADRDATIDMLENLCTSGGPRGRYTLTRSEGTRARQCAVMIDDQVTTWVKPDGLSVGFSTQLYAPDPRMFGTQLRATSAIGLDAPAPGGVLWNGPDCTSGTPWNPGLVLQSGTATSGRVDVVNAGSAETPATITITTTTGVTRPAVKLLSTGQRISYNGTLNAGSTLTIDSSTGRVTVDGVVLPGALLDFDLFALQPGSNPLFFSSSSPGEAALMTVTWRDGYNGG